MKNVLDYLSKFVFVFTIIFFFYGFMQFPDSPIRLCGENQYCGKQGQSHTVEDFERYKRYGTINIISFPISFFLLFINNRNKKVAE